MKEFLIGYLDIEKFFQMLLKLFDLVVIEFMRSQGLLAGHGKYVLKGRINIIPPQVKETAGSVTGRTAYHAIQETIFSSEAHLQTTPGEGTVVDIKISVAVLKLRLLRITGNPDGKDAGGV
jgi:hypothetical protein